MEAVQRVAILDPISTGAHLHSEFCRRGVECVAVFSRPDLTPSDFDGRSYVSALQATTVVAVAEKLRALKVTDVIAGSEYGVELAEELSAMMGTPSNRIAADGNPRRDKAVMLRAVAEAGLRVPMTSTAFGLSEIEDMAANGLTFPCVIKPVSSAGSDGVEFCESVDTLLAAATGLFGRQDALGNEIRTVLVQERLTGQQYFINSVSLDGRHYIHEIWSDDRLWTNGRPLYDRQILLPSEGVLQGRIREYVSSVLDALGVRNGAAHTEISVDDKGCVLIESAARLEGSATPSAPRAVTGTSQVELVVEAIVDPDAFRRRLGTHYSLSGCLMVVVMIAPHHGVLDGAVQQQLAGLAGMQGGSFLSKPAGSTVTATVDLFTSPGHVNLIGPSLAALEATYLKIRELEHDGLYAGGRS